MSKLAEYLYKLRDDKPFYPLYLSVLIIVLLLSPLFAFGTSDKVVSLMGGVGGLVGGVFTVLAVCFAFKQYNEQKREMLLQRGREYAVRLESIELPGLKEHLKLRLNDYLCSAHRIINESTIPPAGKKLTEKDYDLAMKVRGRLKQNFITYEYSQCKESRKLNRLDEKKEVFDSVCEFIDDYLEILSFIRYFHVAQEDDIYTHFVNGSKDKVQSNKLYDCLSDECADSHMIDAESSYKAFVEKIDALERLFKDCRLR